AMPTEGRHGSCCSEVLSLYGYFFGAVYGFWGVFALARLTNVDTALEEGAIFNADALRNDIAGQRTFAADVDTVAGIDVAAYLTQHDYFAGRDIGGNLSVAP